MQGLTSVGGLISGINTDDLIQKIADVERQPIQIYRARQDSLRAQASAFQEANTRLKALRDAADQLAGASFFSSRTATSSNTAVAAATADIGATPGDYVVSVESLARAHQVLSQGYGDLDTTRLGTGTLTITAAGQTTTVEVESGSNTLAGLRDAINRANTNVRASIVQDGDASYRLMISSKETGTANALTIVSTLSSGTAPAFADLQTAQDAQVKLGTGAGAITIVRSSNTIRDLIPGVTLNLASASPGNPITVTVAQDRSRIQDAVQKLVDQYNNAVDYLNQQFRFDPETNKGGTLLGDFTLGSVQNELTSVFATAVTGLANGGLEDAGVTMGTDGKLSLNASVLQSKLDADPDSVARIFALTSQATNAGVQFVSAGAKTALDGTAYAVEITRAATQARVTAGAAQSGLLGADETLTVNGVSISLTAGMTQSQVVDAVNARTKDTGVRAAATAADGTGTGSYLSFVTAGYGSAASVSVVSSRSLAAGDSSGVGSVAATAATPSGESGAGTGQAGVDVAGTINGEAATGTGQVLVGNAGNATTDGLRLRITTATTGSLGSIQLFDGIASKASRTLDGITDVVSGPIQTAEDSLQARIDDLQSTIDAREDAVKRKEDALRAKFNRMEQALAELQGQSSYLASQLGGPQK